MPRFDQWILTANEVLLAIGETPRPAGSSYVVPSTQGRIAFWVVEKVRRPRLGAGYQRDDTKAFRVMESDIRTFLEGQGETLPSSIEIFVRPSTLGGLLNDEVVVVDNTAGTIRKL